jgi:hypothetical protein
VTRRRPAVAVVVLVVCVAAIVVAAITDASTSLPILLVFVYAGGAVAILGGSTRGTRTRDLRRDSLYRRAQTAARLRPLRFHGLRHSFGSLVILEFDPVSVKDFMGHANVTTTERYLHARSRRTDAARMTKAFAGDAVVLSVEREGQRQTVRVYDGAHGVNELHRHTAAPKQAGEVFHSGSVGEGMRAAIAECMTGYAQMIEAWNRGRTAKPVLPTPPFSRRSIWASNATPIPMARASLTPNSRTQDVRSHEPLRRVVRLSCARLTAAGSCSCRRHAAAA